MTNAANGVVASIGEFPSHPPTVLQTTMKTILKLLAPYIAVAVFWCVFANAWLAILAYHAQILVWHWSDLRRMRKLHTPRAILIAFPCVLAGPLLYFMLPRITLADLPTWLSLHHLTGLSVLLMIPYFGVIHPFLEQIHWLELRERTVLAHPVFAGYHMLVLSSLLALPWLFLCFAVLVAASLWWKQVARTTNGLTIPTLSHVLADLGVVIAAWARTQ